MFGELRIDSARREVTLAGEVIALTRTEFDILDALSARPKFAFTRRQLIDEVWDTSWVGDDLRVTATCVEVRGGRLTVECRATDSYGRELGRGSTVQAVLPADVVEARVSEEARLSRRRASDAEGVPASSRS